MFEENGLGKRTKVFLKINKFKFFSFEGKYFLDFLFTLFEHLHLMGIVLLVIFSFNTHDPLKLSFRNMYLRMIRDK